MVTDEMVSAFLRSQGSLPFIDPYYHITVRRALQAAWDVQPGENKVKERCIEIVENYFEEGWVVTDEDMAELSKRMRKG